MSATVIYRDQDSNRRRHFNRHQKREEWHCYQRLAKSERRANDSCQKQNGRGENRCMFRNHAFQAYLGLVGMGRETNRAVAYFVCLPNQVRCVAPCIEL